MQDPLQQLHQYNWDDLESPPCDFNNLASAEKLNRSGFFRRRHSKHEKFAADDRFEFVEIKQELMDCNRQDENTDQKENQSAALNKPQTPNTSEHDALSIKKESCKSEISPPSNCAANAAPPNKRAPPNLVKQPWSSGPKPAMGGKLLAKNLGGGPSGAKPSTSKPEPPTAYQFKDIYEKKKEEKLKRLLEEEKKQRVFHSRPVPNFNALHTQLMRKAHSEPIKFTAALTPMVLKKSREVEEKRRKRIEEWKKQHQPLKFTSRDPHVLHEEPFKPKTVPHAVEPKPFNLHLEKRLDERKHYDEHVKKSMEEKKKQEEEERLKREDEQVRELRKQATFKARPNPFK